MTKREKKSGIYKITNIKNGKVYIGQSVNLDVRIKNHMYHLEKEDHYNQLLQRSFKKYGKENFVIEVMEECDVEELDDKERFWISFFDSTNREYGYNFESGGHSNKVLHAETRKKLSEHFKKARLGEGNPMYGRKLPKYRIKQLRMTNRGRSDKLTERDVRHIKMALYLGRSQIELSSMYEVSHSTINKIAKVANWEWVLSDLNKSISESYQVNKEERNKRIKEMFDDGFPSTVIAYTLNCTRNTVVRVVGVKRKDLIADRNSLIINDFNEGVSRKELANKYSLEESTVKTIVSEHARKKRADNYNKVMELHREGRTNKEIADTLGMHRTTVTEYIKGRVKGNVKKSKPLTDDLKNKILSLHQVGISQREISRKLEVSRFNIRKTIKGA